MKKYLIILVMFFYATYSNADPWHPETGWMKVTHLYPANGGLAFMVSVPNSELSLCDGGRRFIVRLDHENYQVLASTILLAYSMGKDIRMNLNDQELPNCDPSINRLVVH